MSSDKATIAHAFNEYFTNLGPTLAGKIPNLSRNALSCLTGDFRDSFVLYGTTESEIIKSLFRASSIHIVDVCGFDKEKQTKWYKMAESHALTCIGCKQSVDERDC